MTDRASIVERVQQIAERVAGDVGLEVVEVEFVGAGNRRVLRIFIDKPAGVTHADCEYISQNVGTILDVEDVVPGAGYTLEVSSPGLERKLKKPGEFERFVGRKVNVVLRQPVENQRHWVGHLKGFAQGIITLEASPGRDIQIPFEQVERANLEPQFEW